jgi:hypothetical protein
VSSAIKYTLPLSKVTVKVYFTPKTIKRVDNFGCETGGKRLYHTIQLYSVVCVAVSEGADAEVESNPDSDGIAWPSSSRTRGLLYPTLLSKLAFSFISCQL